MHRAYVPKRFIDEWLNHKAISLPDDVAHRFLRVVRIKPQESVAVFDGQGRQIQGELVLDEHKKTYAMPAAILITEEPQKPRIILVQAAIELAKMSQVVQRACEFGVDEIVIFEAENSDAFCFSKVEKKREKLEDIAIDAARQSGRLFVPEIIFTQSLTAALKKEPRGDYFSIFGLPQAPERLSEALAARYKPNNDFLLVVGPEGGLSSSEAKALMQTGLCGVRWAPHILRTESAGLFAMAVFQAFCGRA